MLFDNKTMTVELRSIKTGERFVKSTGDVCISTCDCSIPMMVVLSKPHNLSWALREMRVHEGKWYTHQNACGQFANVDGVIMYRPYNGEPRKAVIDYSLIRSTDWRPVETEPAIKAAPDMDAVRDKLSQLCRVLGVEVVRTVEVQP